MQKVVSDSINGTVFFGQIQTPAFDSLMACDRPNFSYNKIYAAFFHDKFYLSVWITYVKVVEKICVGVGSISCYS